MAGLHKRHVGDILKDWEDDSQEKDALAIAVLAEEMFQHLAEVTGYVLANQPELEDLLHLLEGDSIHNPRPGAMH